MNKNIKYFLIALAVILVPLFLQMYSISYHKDLKSHPITYAYRIYRGEPDYVFGVDDKKDFSLLREYYDSIAKVYNRMELYPSFKFRRRTIPPEYPLYLLEYSPDSLMVKVACYGDFGPRSPNYFITYIYSKTLQKVSGSDWEYTDDVGYPFNVGP